MAAVLFLRIQRQVFHQQRPWAYQAHIALEHIPEFRQLIQAGGAQKATKRCHALVIWQGVAVFVRGVQHGAEFHHLKRFAVQAWAGLAEEYGGAEFAVDQHSNNHNNRKQNHPRKGRSQHIEQSLTPSTPTSPNINSLTRYTSYFCSATSRERSPIPATSSGFSINLTIAAANSSTACTGTKNPLSPSVTVSRQPAASVVITGRPMAMASSTVRR